MPRRTRRSRLPVLDDLRDALYASNIASYTQGFQMLSRASAERGYGTDLGEVARIWTAGCIIRARFLDRVRAAFTRKPEPELLALAPEFVEDLRRRLPAWRRVVTRSPSGAWCSGWPPVSKRVTSAAGARRGNGPAARPP